MPGAPPLGQGSAQSLPPSDSLGKVSSLGHLWGECVAEASPALLSGIRGGGCGGKIWIGGLHAVISPSCQGHMEELWGLATHPSQAQFVTCGQDKLVHLWSVESHQPLWSRTIEVRGWGT